MSNNEIIVYVNEQHTIMEGQQRLLDELSEEGWTQVVRLVPKTGWTKKEMEKEMEETFGKPGVSRVAVFVSPIPYMLKVLSFEAGYASAMTGPPIYNVDRVLVFHNDKRDKKELPNGKVISVMAKNGWELV